MGKQSRRRAGRERGAEEATRYLRRLGLPSRPDPGAQQRLAAADPAWFQRLSELDDRSVALAEGGVPDTEAFEAVALAKYRLVYRDLDTALVDYAAKAVAVATAWLPWWLEHHPAADRVLDAGCGAGVLTCAYALALPEAEVVGVDFVPEAVACAEELARRVGAGNASFVTADFTHPPAADAVSRGFDQVLAVTALGDARLYPRDRPGQDPFSSVAEVDGPAQGYQAPGISSLVGQARPGGWVLAFERTHDARQAAWLGSALVHAGVDLDLNRAGAELVEEDGQRSTFTRFAGRASHGPATTAALAAWLKAVTPPAYGPAWHDELRFERLRATGAVLIRGLEIDYAPHDHLVERREAWAHGTTGYGWVTTSAGLRQLTRAPSIEALLAALQAYAQKLSVAGLEVRAYSPR